MKRPRIVVLPPTPEWKETKGSKSFINREKERGFTIEYEFMAKVFCCGSCSGNCLNDVAEVDERRSCITTGKTAGLSKQRDSSQHSLKWAIREEIDGIKMERKPQVKTFLPPVKEASGKKIGMSGRTISSSVRKNPPRQKAVPHFRTAASSAKHVVAVETQKQVSSVEKVSSSHHKPSVKGFTKAVPSLTHGELDRKRTTSKQSSLIKTDKKSLNPLKHDKLFTKQANRQAVKSKISYSSCKDVPLSARSKSSSATDIDLQGIGASPTDNNNISLLSHSGCNLFPVTLEQLYEEVETLQPPRPSAPVLPSSNEDLSTPFRKRSLHNPSFSGFSACETNIETVDSLCSAEEAESEVVLPQITIDEVLKSWHVSHPRRGRSCSNSKISHDPLQFLMKSPEAAEESPAERLARTESEYEKLKRCRYLRLGREHENLVRKDTECSCNSCEHVKGLKATPYLNS